jgi:hypothetical protein
MVNELIKAGITGDELLRAVMELTGYDETNARQLIGIETGTWKGDVIEIDVDALAAEAPPAPAAQA